MGETKTINVDIDAALWRDVRIAALRRGVLVREFVDEALRRAVQEQQEVTP